MMSKITSLFMYVMFLSALNSSFAQTATIQWQNALGGSAFDMAQSVRETPDGGLVVAGITTSANGNVTGNHGFGDFWIVKLDSMGTLLWQKCYGGSADDGAFSISLTADSGFVVAGSATSADGNVTLNQGGLDYWIIKLDSAGNLLWQKSLGGTGNEIPYSISQTDDMGFIIAGYTTSTDGNVSSNHGFEDYWIVKLDIAGNPEWEKTLGGTMDERAYYIQQTDDGGYVTCGYTKSTNGDVTGNHGDYDFWVVKLDATGSLQWQRSLGGSNSDKAQSLTESQNGNYVVAGFSASINGDVTVNHGGSDLWMVSMDSAGTIEWERSLGGSGVDQAYTIMHDNNGYIMAGSSYSLDGDVTGNHGGYDYWVVKTDSIGNIEWEKSLGGSSVDEAYNIQKLKSGSYVVAGGTLSINGDITGSHGDFDYWVVKLDSTAVTFIEDFTEIAKVCMIYPNPAQDHCTIIAPEFIDASLSIYDFTGREIFTSHFEEKENINIEKLSSGCYMVTLTDRNFYKAQRKLIKE